MLKIYAFSPKFSAGGLCDWGILLVISLEFQGNKASTVFYDTTKLFNYFSRHKNIILNNAGSIAEASLKLNKVFETAQAAADQYVESVKSMAREEIREYMKRKIDG